MTCTRKIASYKTLLFALRKHYNKAFLLFKTAAGLNREVDLEKLNSLRHKAFNAQLTLRNVQSQSQISKSSAQHGNKALHIQPSISNSPADVKNIQNALQKMNSSVMWH